MRVTDSKMTASAPDQPSGAPRSVLLLPVALLLHQVEEWFWGFPTWIAIIFGSEVPSEQFLAINAVGLAIFVVGALAAFLAPQMAWIAVSLASLIGLNAVLHALVSLVAGSVSPGTITGFLLYIPLSAMLLRSLAQRLPRTVFAGAVVAGVLLHALATFSALQ